MSTTTLVAMLGATRILIGITPIVAPRYGMKLFRFPPEHDNPTGRLMGRLFGVRDIGLGVMALLAAAYYPAWLGFVCLFNAAHDAGDVLSFAIPLVRRHDIDRSATLGLAVAGPAVALWLFAWSLL